MATSCFQILLSFLFLSFCGVQVNCKPEEYALNLVEEGTPVREEVDIDTEKGTEVIRVPGHNDVKPMEVMNDFVANLTARRLPSTRVCYVSELDSTLPSPQKLKIDMDQAKKQPLSDEKIIKETTTTVLGLANRLELPKRILDFCGKFPIYNVEEVTLDAMNAPLYKTRGQGRNKRSLRLSACTTSDVSVVESCLDSYGRGRLKSYNCRYYPHNCYYIISCCYNGFDGYNCKASGHVYKSYCCRYSCNPPTYAPIYYPNNVDEPIPLSGHYLS